MVEVSRAPSLGQNAVVVAEGVYGTTSRFADMKLASIHETKVLTTSEEEDRSEKEHAHNSKKGSYQPRRAFTAIEYRLPTTPSTPSSRLQSPAVTPSLNAKLAELDSYFQLPIPPTTASRSSNPSSPSDSSASSHVSSTSSSNKSFEVSASVPPGHVPPTRRPVLPPQQRSYSVMDYVPIPVLHLPGEKLQLLHLPPEIHFAIFDFLDPIDSTCLGLTNKHFYAIHRRMHGTIPLSARRQGPNDMEWAWRGAGPLMDAATGKDPSSSLTKENAMRPRGQVYCRKCGVLRCELHKHISEWMGDKYEYCEVRQKFGPRAPSGAKKSCYRSSPRHPHRCGRHTRQQRAVRLV